MSSYYYRVTSEPDTAEVYGFRKVCKAELREIVSRLTKPTYNSRIQSEEPHKIHNYSNISSTIPPRTPSSCKRFVHGQQSGNVDENRKLTARELQRLLRRIQKPTRAHLLSRNSYDESVERDLSCVTPTTSLRPTTTYEREKAFQHLCRPTTASRAKHATECYLCLEDEREMNKTLVPFEYFYANDKSVTNEEVVSIVSRLSSSTRASDRGSTVCCRVSPDYDSVHVQSLRLPLVSGLARSKSVAEIVDRLHSNNGCKRIKNFHGYSTMATQITNYTDS